MLKRTVVSAAYIFLVSLLAFSVQADDVLIKNTSDNPVVFYITDLNTRLFSSATLQPGETRNALNRDLRRGDRIYIFAPDADPRKQCSLIVDEIEVSTSLGKFYLPDVFGLYGVRTCPFKSNVPTCGCFNPVISLRCFSSCLKVTNAQVVVEKFAQAE